MSRKGGFLVGPWWQYDSDLDEQIYRRYAVAWGEIVKDPEDRFEDGGRIIRFIIKTGRGADRTEDHLVCIAWGENLVSIIMRALERGDYVLATGTWVDYRKAGTKKDKKSGLTRKKKKYELRVDFVIPLAAVANLVAMSGTPEIMRMVENFQNTGADPWVE